jgi:hypothetical protein
MKRRDFVHLAAAALGGLAPRLLTSAHAQGGYPERSSTRPGITRARKRFREVAASLYPWDLLDEGIDPILDTLAETTGTNSVYLVALMHQEKRPLTDFYYPHNPKRKTYFPEDSRVYWKPSADAYQGSKIKPRGSDRDELKNTDWLRMLITAGRKRRWKTGAEISHTILDKERAPQFRSAVQHDIYGNPMGQLVCCNSPDARAYAVGLATDLVKNYDIDYLQTCLIPFAAGRTRISGGPSGGLAYRGSGLGGLGVGQGAPIERILQTCLGGCFCSHCEAVAKTRGLNLPAVRKALLPLADMLDHAGPEDIHRWAVLRGSNTTPTAMLMRHRELYDWLKFRCDSFSALFGEIGGAVRKIKPRIDLRLNAFLSWDPELHGIDMAGMKRHLGSVRSSDYSEQEGNAAAMEHKREFLLNVRAAIGDDMPFLSAIGIRPKATPELIRQGVLISTQCGADGLSLGHYDGAPLRNLLAIKQGLFEADTAI